MAGRDTPLRASAAPAAAAGDPVSRHRARDLTVRFDIAARGLLQRTVRRVNDGGEAVASTVAPGETLALVGESGCGKSTTGKALMGLVGWQGSIRIDGVEAAGLKPTATEAAAPQHPDGVPGSLRLARPAHECGRAGGRTAPVIRCSACVDELTRAWSNGCCERVGLRAGAMQAIATHMNFPAASASASASPGRSSLSPKASSSPTNRSRPWTSRSRPRCWICCMSCRADTRHCLSLHLARHGRGGADQPSDRRDVFPARSSRPAPAARSSRIPATPTRKLMQAVPIADRAAAATISSACPARCPARCGRSGISRNWSTWPMSATGIQARRLGLINYPGQVYSHPPGQMHMVDAPDAGVAPYRRRHLQLSCGMAAVSAPRLSSSSMRARASPMQRCAPPPKIGCRRVGTMRWMSNTSGSA